MSTLYVKTHKKQTEVTIGSAGDLVTIPSFAPRIGWHPESLRRACRQGRVAAVKLGRDWRIPQAVAENILRNGIPKKA